MSASIIGGIVKKVVSKAKSIARFDASGRVGEEFSGRKVLQHFGVSSCPPEGAECLIVRQGQNIYMIASDDRRYRIELKDGETALYDSHGNTVHLQEGGKILVKSNAEVKVVSNKVIVESGQIYLGSELAANAGGGVVTMMCSCSMTGALHPVSSQTVKAAL